PQPHAIQKASRLLRQGGLVAFPTETVYGLGANAFDPEVVRRLFAAKERPLADPLIVHIADLGQLSETARDIPSATWDLASRFWPGPLTLILPRSPRIPSLVSAGLETVAVRMPDHPVDLAIIRESGVPIVAPSANRFG